MMTSFCARIPEHGPEGLDDQHRLVRVALHERRDLPEEAPGAPCRLVAAGAAGRYLAALDRVLAGTVDDSDHEGGEDLLVGG
jgi:hypothetical protein